MFVLGKVNRRNLGDDIIFDLCDFFIYIYINVFFLCVIGKIDYGGWKNYDILIITYCLLIEYI